MPPVKRPKASWRRDRRRPILLVHRSLKAGCGPVYVRLGPYRAEREGSK